MRPYNDIDVYVEDRIYKGVYERLINNVLRGRGRVSHVIPLGPSEIVIAEAKKDTETGGRPRLYVVDGDLDLIAFYRKKTHLRLYRLSVYSLENLLLEEKAVESYVKFALPGMTSNEALATVNLEELFQRIDIVSRTYVVLLGIARRLKLRDNSLKFDQTIFLRKTRGKYVKLDTRRLNRKLYEAISFVKTSSGRSRYRATKRQVLRIIREKELAAVKYFPGKTALWMLNELIGVAGGLQNNQRVIVSYLANECQLSLDRKLARRLRSLTQSST
jgi:hypothetical protein